MPNTMTQLRGKPAADLVKELAASRERLWSLKLDLAQGKVKNVREIKQLKRTIARIETIMRAEELKSSTKKR